MTRRRLAAFAAAVLSVGAAGCSALSGNDAAAVVDGVEISRSDYEAVLRAYDTAQKDEQAATTTVAGDEATTPTSSTLLDAVSGPTGRGALTALVRAQAVQAFLAEHGEAVTDEELQAEQASEAGTERAWFAELPTDLHALISGLNASTAALGRVGAGRAQETYERSPAAAGVVCLRVIVVETEDDAAAIAGELAAGGDFAELAAERSVLEGADENGGVQTDPQTGSDCLPVDSLQVGNPLVDTALSLAPGEVSEPIEAAIDANGTMGWYLLHARPYEEVAESVDAAWGEPAFQDWLGTVDVTVDARYGRWDPESVTVVAL